MKRPWQVWLLFLASLAVVVPAMGWLTLKALELDRSQAEAQQQAQLEQEIRLALWRMDTALMPLLAREAARPPASYLPPEIVDDDDPGSGALPSPLLRQPSPHILLHFQCDPLSGWSSPEVPPHDVAQRAVEEGIAPRTIAEHALRLEELSRHVPPQQLLAKLPRATLPALPAVAGVGSWADNQSPPGQMLLAEDPNFSGQAVNDLGLAQLKQQLAELDPLAVDQEPGTQADRRGGPSQAASVSPQEQQRRGGFEWTKRNQAYQSIAQQAVVQQRLQPQAPVAVPSVPLAGEGVSQPIWIGSRLLLARRVQIGEHAVAQGCWLNWPQLHELLLAEVGSRLPPTQLIPVTAESVVDAGRMLATLPVQLVVAEQPIGPAPMSPIRLSLWLAWSCLTLAALAVGLLLLGVIRLSERRGAFVSAVTHELRTPLTTFRMYAEMLAEDMVPDAGQRRSYLQTLRAEAERLSHLVENVLAYARLERGRRHGKDERLTLQELLDRVEPRLRDRAEQAGMTLLVQADPPSRAAAVRTNISAVEQILLNLVDNACKYAGGAEDRRIELQLEAADRVARLRVSDHGPGIADRAPRDLFRPFSKSAQQAAHSAPGVGLGLALCRRLARDLGGRLEAERRAGPGASFVLKLPLQ